MASLKTKMTGNLGAQRESSAASFYGRKVKNAGQGPGQSPFSPAGRARLEQTDAQKGSLPSGGNTVGGCVGGLYDKGNYQGMKAGKS